MGRIPQSLPEQRNGGASVPKHAAANTGTLPVRSSSWILFVVSDFELKTEKTPTKQLEKNLKQKNNDL